MAMCRMDLMLSTASLCVVGYPLLMRYTTLLGEEEEIVNATVGGCA